MEDPQYQLCREGFDGQPLCIFNSLTPVHETNNTLLVSVTTPEFMGPALDAIYNEGFKVEAIIPDLTQGDTPNTWIYFVK